MSDDLAGNIIMILLLLLLLLVVVALFRSVFKVQQGYTVIVERLGRYNKTLQPGLHFLIPFFVYRSPTHRYA
jgi:SPFH domain, Band 7 family protein